MKEKNRLRKWLAPFSWIYGSGVVMRNWLFDRQIKKSVEFELPVISVGNLSTGGTGKTPHVEYLIRLLRNQYQLGVLSRGYKRKTEGYYLSSDTSTVDEVGDEPLQIKKKFPDVMVAVCEERVIGIPIMLLENPALQVVILDDAFQHRQVKAGLSILLTDYSKLFTKDQLLPAGNLREPSSGAQRADVIIVTKCSPKISADEEKRISREVRMNEGQPVLFSSMAYDEPYHAFDATRKLSLNSSTTALLVTAIVSGRILLNELKKSGAIVTHLEFRDHHRFSLKEIRGMITKVKEISKDNPIIITTEKDMTRLIPYHDLFASEQVEIYCAPVQVKFIGDDEAIFNSMILDFVEAKLKDSSDG